MKRVLISIFVIALVFSLSTASACEKAKACAAAGKKSCCAAKAEASAAQVASGGEGVKGSEMEGQACPDVSGKTALQQFHETMHPMHLALQEGNLGAIREGLPGLLEAAKAVDKYKCEGYDKCSKDCRKTFKRSKGDLLDAIKSVKKACKGKDDENLAASFNKMHEAYIAFANSCKL